jgi:hypothetical protein
MEEHAFRADVRDGREAVGLQLGAAKLELNTAQLSELISVLSSIREQMLPQIQGDAPDRFRFEENPRFVVKGAGPLGGIFIGLRHAGLGWVFGHLAQSEAKNLAQGLQKIHLQFLLPERKH